MNLALGRETLKKIWALKSAIDEVIAPFGESQTADEIYTVANFAEVKPFMLEDKEVDKLYKWAVLKYDGDENVMKKMIQFASSWKECNKKSAKKRGDSRRTGTVREKSPGRWVIISMLMSIKCFKA